MILKVELELINGEMYNFYAEVEAKPTGYKFTMPDGSGIEIKAELIKNVRIEGEADGIEVAGEIKSIIMPRCAPHYNEIEPEKIEKFR
jgi:hypothetical protein